MTSSLRFFAQLCAGALLGFVCACPGTAVAPCSGSACDAGDSNIAPQLYVQPVFGLGFDCVAIGCVQAREVTLSNRGGGVLTVTSAQLTAGTSADFGLETDPPLPLDLRGGQSAALTVVYRPSDAQQDLGLLRVITVSTPAPLVPISGVVELPLRVRQNGDPVLGLYRQHDDGELSEISNDNDTFSFAYVEGGSIERRDLIIRNDTAGNAILELLEIKPGELYEPAFYFAPLTDEQRLVNPGQEIRVELQMLPGSAAVDLRRYDAEIVVRSSDPLYPERVVHLFGTSQRVAIIEVRPTSVELGTTDYGFAKQASLLIRNNGGVDLLVTPQLIAGASVGYSVVGDQQALPPIEPFMEATLQINLDATSGGPASGRLRLQSNDPDNMQLDVPLAAFVNAPVLSVSPDPVTFSTTIQSWSAYPIVLQLSNSGFGPLEITNIRFEVGSSSQFSLANLPTLPTVLQPTDTPISIEVGYTAFTLGPAQGLIVVNSNSSEQARSEVVVTGTGVTCEQGCILPHARSNCFGGECTVEACEGAYFNADVDDKNGCECLAESPEVGGFCGSASDVGTLGDDSTTRTGNLHSAEDVDVYWFYAADEGNLCMPFSDDGKINVDFTAAAPGVEFCVSYIDHQAGGDGCGLGSESCGHRNWEFDDTSCGSDDDRDVTVRVRMTPGAAPACAAYTIRFKTSM